MRLGGYFNLSPSFAAVMAMSYLVPWCIENYNGFVQRERHEVFTARPNHLPVYQPPHPNGNGGGGGGADCGAAPRDQGPQVAASVALQNILEAVPARVFVNEGDCCSICLEDFSGDAVQVRIEINCDQ